MTVSLRVTVVPVTPFRQNCSIARREASGRAAVVDPRGDHETLVRSIRERLFPPGEDIRFVPGRGPTSTFGEERRSRPE
jgi:glyoxylase-like metal-dependent hydrolase (beta-lactamase superfamily II)